MANTNISINAIIKKISDDNDNDIQDNEAPEKRFLQHAKTNSPLGNARHKNKLAV